MQVLFSVFSKFFRSAPPLRFGEGAGGRGWILPASARRQAEDVDGAVGISNGQVASVRSEGEDVGDKRARGRPLPEQSSGLAPMVLRFARRDAGVSDVPP